MSSAELAIFGKSVKETLEQLENTIFLNQKTCSQCKGSFSSVQTNGLCMDCQKFQDEQMFANNHVTRIVGKWAQEKFNFEKFQTPTCAHEKAKNIALKFNPLEENLFISGTCGSGKSHLAVAILQEWAGSVGGSIGYERMTELMRFLRGMKGAEEAQFIESLSARRLLVLDDLGVGRGTEFMLSVAYEIIESRSFRGRKGLVITSNLGPDALSEKFGDDRLSSRIAGTFTILRADLEDWRMTEKQNNQKDY